MGNDEKNNTNENKNENNQANHNYQKCQTYQNNQVSQNNQVNQINQYKSNKNVNNERRKCPYCDYLYLYSNQREINYYNKHVNSCTKRKPKVNHKLPTPPKLNYKNIQVEAANFNYIKNNFHNNLTNANKNFNNNNNNFKIQNTNNINYNLQNKNKNLNTNNNNNNYKNNNFNNTYRNNAIQTETNNQQKINKKPKMIGSLLITDSLNEFLNDGKVELPRGNKYGTFEEKVDYLRYDISQTKVDFTEGCETLFISRENVFENSLIQIETFNIHKEIKIIFIGEENSDAGGLIREWLTILFKQIMDEKLGLFERSDTDEISYIIKRNIRNDKEILDKYYFIGKVLAKALLENLTVNCCLNKAIYQLILKENIKFEDFIFIDKPLYNSLNNLKKLKEQQSDIDNIAFCEIYFSCDYKDDRGNLVTKNLIPNGKNILVTKDNLDLYISKRIEEFKNSQLIGVNEIIKGINSVFDINYLKIFTSDQLELLINGTPFIDVEDWRLNTQYKNYNDYDDTIIMFWEVISSLSQEELSNFLLFCTGSSKVPIGGFKSLESNRGQISKFEIVKIEYKQGAKNFLRVHTCFNRLDLPEFPDEYSLRQAIKFALENQVLGYGIE